jgi:hypothetical protein
MVTTSRASQRKHGNGRIQSNPVISSHVAPMRVCQRSLSELAAAVQINKGGHKACLRLGTGGTIEHHLYFQDLHAPTALVFDQQDDIRG